jgi:hypothetical protein
MQQAHVAVPVLLGGLHSFSAAAIEAEPALGHAASTLLG